jgi:hypothetical protein
MSSLSAANAEFEPPVETLAQMHHPDNLLQALGLCPLEMCPLLAPRLLSTLHTPDNRSAVLRLCPQLRTTISIANRDDAREQIRIGLVAPPQQATTSISECGAAYASQCGGAKRMASVRRRCCSLGHLKKDITSRVAGAGARGSWDRPSARPRKS